MLFSSVFFIIAALLATSRAQSCIAPDGKDLSGMMSSTPFSLSTGRYAYSFDLCLTPLRQPCNFEPGSIACQTIGGTAQVSLAQASTGVIDVIDRGYSFSYKNGDNGRNVLIEVTCNPASPAVPTDWTVVNHPDLSYIFSATSSVACAPCKANDGTDVSRLASPNGLYFAPISGSRAVFFQVCSGLPMNCQGYTNISACVFSGNEQYALGTTASQVIAATDNGYSFSFGSAVPGSTVTIAFTCGGPPGSPITWASQNSGNNWIFSAETQLACPPAPAGSCVANDGFSLARLNNPSGFSWYDGSKFTYTISLCSPLSSPCDFNNHAAGCQSYSSGTGQILIGQFSTGGGQIIKVSGGYQFLFRNGDNGRTMAVQVNCDALLNRQLVIQSVNSTAALEYEITASSPYACN